VLDGRACRSWFAVDLRARRPGTRRRKSIATSRSLLVRDPQVRRPLAESTCAPVQLLPGWHPRDPPRHAPHGPVRKVSAVERSNRSHGDTRPRRASECGPKPDSWRTRMPAACAGQVGGRLTHPNRERPKHGKHARPPGTTAGPVPHRPCVAPAPGLEPAGPAGPAAFRKNHRFRGVSPLGPPLFLNSAAPETRTG